MGLPEWPSAIPKPWRSNRRTETGQCQCDKPDPNVSVVLVLPFALSSVPYVEKQFHRMTSDRRYIT